ncbi:MarR family winged helix-turn-helix transcriptional regulator [Yoonia vestfoldensis]|uniref:MarR family winged helix-turn-helix transcriptional regulator n=1 Tax=Yoonia vestfoldensis TaxID=245188 RepID=UPI0003729923|nr:MarR family transcriptional regulator [Yoonia vestfoldensis]
MDEEGRRVFRFFNEIGIINQLAGAIFAARLPGGLHVSHFALLNHLVRLGDEKTPLALASAFQVPKTTMTHTLAVLEKRAAIRLAPHPSDGRSKIVFLTDAGRKLHGDAIASMADPIRKITDDLGDGTISDLIPQLEKIRAYLDQNRGI